MAYVQYGCERITPPEWINFDSSPTLRFERIPVIGKLYTKNDVRFPENVRYGDIVKGLPIADNSVDAVFCSHVLEHLSRDDLEPALRNTRRILKPGGIFRFVLPDIETLAVRYLESKDSDAFVRKLQMGREKRARNIFSFVIEWLGAAHHLWMWDEQSMARELRFRGFENIRRVQFGDSGDPMFDKVERKYRFDDCLAMQCTKSSVIDLPKGVRGTHAA